MVFPYKYIVKSTFYTAGDVPAEPFYENHTKIHDTVKGRLAPAFLTPFCNSLSNKFRDYIKAWGTKGNDIYPSTLEIIYIQCNVIL